ncbi:hypothetical protein [uncultured Friedmanniella sp.]|uniref:hypothetical protein n=1 Tax=uncultured Friedmanniella sp. TaxID=335381 RepID=UPI0035CB2155
MDASELAAELLAGCVADGQAVRRVPVDAEADLVRAELRRLARRGDVRVRTARLDDTVVVARTDAALWTDDTVTMRRKLTPQD